MVFSHLPKVENRRHERKFVVERLPFYEVEFLIHSHDSIFRKSFPSRRVNNIYFDSVHLESYFSNIEGYPERVKVRIRWYGKFFGAVKKPSLEIKVKKSEIGTKLVYPLCKFRMDKNVNFDFIYNEVFLKSNLPEWLLKKLKYLHFSLSNSYVRNYYISADNKFRITLDNNLEFAKLNSLKNTFLHSHIDNNLVILELKYSDEHDNLAHYITNNFPFRLSRSSKYVSGINYLI